ncbi:MAG: hypothetical protein HDT39_09020 [Lachnospiraceae bacterium]|nr:hypothetical protein [Lachnospiraceae bacterium]
MKKLVSVIAGGVLGLAAGAAAIGKMNKKVIKEKENTKKRYKKYYDIMNYWMEANYRGRSISECLKEKEYTNIVIYGMGELGNRLYEQLQKTDVKVMYAIDKNPVSSYSELNVVGAAMETTGVDAVIVTPVYDFDKIKEDLEGIFDCKIISLEEIVYEM